MAMEHIDSHNEDTIPLMEVWTLFEQSTFAFDTFCFLDTLVEGKSKFKEILKEQYDSLNEFLNQCLFGSYFEYEFSKLFTAKQRSKSLFTGLRMFSTSIKIFIERSLSASQM